MRVAYFCVLTFPLFTAASGAQSDVEAQRILEANCTACHGATRMGGLDLRSRDAALRGGTRGAAVVPGDPENSLLYNAVRAQDGLTMPPGKKRLEPAEIAAIKTWIERGAPWKENATGMESSWWSFRKLARPQVPATGEKNPIDAFVNAALQRHKLKAMRKADRRVLIRRATFDLQGLPPSPEDVERFVNDPAPDAYEKLIDSLLASKRYGERWGRHWLDVVRYADTGGFETDIYFPNAWRYRDYVIKSFNDDKPWNVFVQEQIAGDELWPGDIEYEGTFEVPAAKLTKLEARIGTGMYTIGPVYHEAALFEGQARYEWLSEAVDTTGEAFLGVTLGCARCHDHKFDPLTQRDYHAMMAVFAGSEEREIPAVPKFSIYGFKSGYPKWLRVEELKSAIGRIDKTARQRLVDSVRSHFSKEALTAYDTPKEKRDDQQRKLAAAVELAMTEAGLRENAAGKEADLSYTKEELAERERLLERLGKAALEANPVMQTATVLGHSGWIPTIRMTHRGDWRSAGDIIAPAFPAVLASDASIAEPQNQPFLLQRRKALALWLTDARHPLSARVIANRVWYWHFGRGIVATPGDFGRQGEPPSHPELLDWLASELMANNWSLKKLHRTIMLSDAYQRSSDPDGENSKKDADNRFLWRMNRQRVDAEILRDSILAVSGQINLKEGGRPVIPPLSREEATGLWARDQWPESLDPSEHNRRSVYLYVKRAFPLPMMSAFDAPDSSLSCSRRETTTVAPQALTLLNSDFMVVQARRMSQRITDQFGPEQAKQIDGAWRLAYGRPPSSSEAQTALSSLNSEADADAMMRLCLVIFNTNEFLYID